MPTPSRLLNERFPRSNRYHPDWLAENPMGAHPLWLAEWLCERLSLEPGMRVLDLGCGKAKSSVFLAREFGVQVWAVDLWTDASENGARVADAGVADMVFPLHADARNLPFAGQFFDAIVCVDSYNYIGTDDGYLPYLVHFLRPGGALAFASAAVMQDVSAEVPEHLQRFWTTDCWTIHTPAWWHQHLAKTGLVEMDCAEAITDGWRLWLDWAEATDASDWYREMLRVDAGRYLGYVGVVAHRVADRPIADYAWPCTLRSMPGGYERHPLLREP